MKNIYHYLEILFFGFSLQACQSPKIPQILAGTDTIEIIYFSPKGKNTLEDERFNIRDKTFIHELLYYISDKDTLIDYCNYEGVMKFHKARVGIVLMEAKFSTHQNCSFMTFQYQNKQFTRLIQPGGVTFLRLARKYKDAIDNEDLL
ncbi:MAG: hypothetical protein NW226_27265 [Microscillaceae bacterium]|nr:hypothetical protein [Microscillaceae bacterium]